MSHMSERYVVKFNEFMREFWTKKMKQKLFGFSCIFLLNYSVVQWAMQYIIMCYSCVVAFECFGLATLSNHNVTSNAIAATFFSFIHFIHLFESDFVFLM